MYSVEFVFVFGPLNMSETSYGDACLISLGLFPPFFCIKVAYN